MVRQLTTRAQVSGYRFLLHRAEHALVRRDARMLHDPMRAQRQSVTVGLVLALLVAAGAGVYGLIRPVGSVADAPIVASRSDGGLYVVVDHTAHPVLNLASARLIAQTPADPKAVSPAALRTLPRGPVLGIVGAPNAIGGAAAATWAVCDAARAHTETRRTAVVVTDGPSPSGIGPERGLFVLVGDTHYLVYRLGHGTAQRTVRARIDAGDARVRRVLGLDDAVPRHLSPALADAIEEVAPLTVPAVTGAGSPGVLGMAVGTVFAVPALEGRADHFVVLSRGVQPVSAVAAALLRMTDDAAPAVPVVAPGRAASAAVVRELPVEHFPQRVPRLVAALDAPVACQSWYRPPGAPAATTALWVGTAVPGGPPVAVVGADGTGPGVDEVRVAAGATHDVRVTGMDPRSSRRHGRFLVGDTGMRYAVADDEAARMLGLGEPGLAPWPILRLLPTGPDLSRAEALVAHGGFK
ncbi:type VII secretion protein EccB [Gordonia crocea]|uniref:Type VII secretion protein EccB n=1 Tax=Gordonia crocea TaxID=589162 RepID=A0A7I9UYQ8_9ACTN|nr:type VII secretion protein EccB [Gordonia crocea]GED98324.1 hypothetical protein nbrc107697_23630 [Gordonia crocea]